MTSPTPRQVGHGRAVITWPSKERWTVCTSPRPPQVSQVTGDELALVPRPWHRSHSTAVSTVTCLLTPVAHSVRSSRNLSNESEPGRTRPTGPREVEPPPKNASKTSPKPPKPPNPLPADAALARVGQRLVGGADLLEFRLGALVVVDVGMQLARQLAIRTFDLRIARVPAHAEQTVIVACHA